VRAPGFIVLILTAWGNNRYPNAALTLAPPPNAQVGRPDGRLFNLTKAESWVLMALQQCKSIVHLLSPPEVLTYSPNNHRLGFYFLHVPGFTPDLTLVDTLLAPH
jgi:hypothetical protein